MKGGMHYGNPMGVLHGAPMAKSFSSHKDDMGESRDMSAGTLSHAVTSKPGTHYGNYGNKKYERGAGGKSKGGMKGMSY